MKIYELLRIRDGKRPQDHGIHHAKDSGVGPDSQCDSQDRNARENRRFCQQAERIAKAGCKSKHVNTSSQQTEQSAYRIAGSRTFESTRTYATPFRATPS